jgi:hypothetical protein
MRAYRPYCAAREAQQAEEPKCLDGRVASVKSARAAYQEKVAGHEISIGELSMTPIKARLLTAMIVAGAMLPAAAPAQTFTTLYTFQGGTKDGANPLNLIYQSGKLYGTTSFNSTKGVIFELSLSSGNEKVLAKFGQDSVGYYIQPNAPTYYNGLLYGSTQLGGNPGCSPSSCGTVVTLDPSSSILTVLYDFPTGGTSDAAHPDTALILANGLFYGAAGVANTELARSIP